MHIRETILEYAGSANLAYIKSQALINHKRNVIFIATPKCACTSFKALILNFETKENKSIEVHNLARKNLEFSALKYSNKKLKNFLESYEIISLWRSPVERFFSAFKDKVLNLSNKESDGTKRDISNHVKRFVPREVFKRWQQEIYDNKQINIKSDLAHILLEGFVDGIVKSHDCTLNPHFASQSYCQRLDLIPFNRINYKISSFPKAVLHFEGTDKKPDNYTLNVSNETTFIEDRFTSNYETTLRARYSLDLILYRSAK